MFKESDYTFQWKDLGDIDTGRPNLGNMVNIAVYRLMQYTIREVLNRKLTVAGASEVLREAGHRAGMEFCRNMLDATLPLNDFLAQVQENLQALKIGILRVERSNPEAMEFMLTVSEDLDCSGLPFGGVTVCEYDEGFIAGLFQAYTGDAFDAREIDCWASGERTCRFRVNRVTI